MKEKKEEHTLTDIYLRTGRFSLRHFDFFQYVLMGTQKQMISHLKALKKIRLESGIKTGKFPSTV